MVDARQRRARMRGLENIVLWELGGKVRGREICMVFGAGFFV